MGFDFIYTMLMDFVIQRRSERRVFAFESDTLRVGTIGADRGSRGLCTFCVFFGISCHSLSGSVLLW